MSDGRLDSIYKVLHKVLGREGGGPLTDAQLLEHFAASQDEMAFEVLVHRHSRTVWNACRRVLGRQHDAEDAFQATFLILTRKAGSIAWRESVAGWLRRVARQVALKAKARARSQAMREQQRAVAEAVEDPTPACVWQEVRSVLDQEIERLPRKYRLPFVLCHLEGKTNAEAGRELGCTEGAVATQLVRARQKLARQLSRRGVTLPAALGAAVVVNKATSAVPAPLISTTVRAGLAYATGGVRAGVVSAEAVTLAEGVAHTMLLTKVGVGVGLVLSVGLLAGGAGIVVGRQLAPSAEAAKPESVSGSVTVGAEEKKTEARRAAPLAAAQPPAVRLDRDGFALPSRALARLGSLRFRHEAKINALAYAPDGKTLIVGGEDGAVLWWDAATGKELRRLQLEKGWQFTFAPDSKVLACVRENKLRLYDLTSGRLLWRKEAPCLWWASLAFAVDGKSLATKSLVREKDSVVRKEKEGVVVCRWDIASGKQLWQTSVSINDPDYHCRGLQSACAPDNKTVAVDSDDALVFLDAATGQELRRLPKHDKKRKVLWASALAYAPDGQTLVEGCGDAISPSLRLWDIASGKPLWQKTNIKETSKGMFEYMEAVVFAPDGKTIASGGFSHGITHMFDRFSMTSLRGRDGAVRVWDAASGKLLWQSEQNIVMMGKLAYAPDSKTLAVGGGEGEEGIVLVWDVASGKLLSKPGGHYRAVDLVAYASGNKDVFTVGKDMTLRRWEAATGRQLAQIPLDGGNRRDDYNYIPELLACSRDGRILATHIYYPHLIQLGKNDSVVQLRDAASGKLLWQKENTDNRTTWPFPSGRTLALTPNGEAFAIATSSTELGNNSKVPVCKVSRWNVASDKQVWEIDLVDSGKPSDLKLPSLAFSPNGQILAVCQSSLALLDAATGKELRRLTTSDGDWYELESTILTFAPDGRTLAEGRNGRTLVAGKQQTAGAVTLWEVASGQKVVHLSLSLDPNVGCRLRALALGPDGRTLASGGDDCLVRLWDLATGRQIHLQSRRRDPVTSLAFAPDGRTLVSGSESGTSLIWDLTHRRDEARRPARELEPKELKMLWDELAGADAEKAVWAARILTDAPATAIPFLRGLLRPAVAPDPTQLRRLAAGLDAEAFAERERSEQEFKDLGVLAVPALRAALAERPSLELRRRVERLLAKLESVLPNLSKEELREYRAVAVLEWAGTAEARRILKELAAGAPGAVQTREAEAALRRLTARDAKP